MGSCWLSVCHLGTKEGEKLLLSFVFLISPSPQGLCYPWSCDHWGLWGGAQGQWPPVPSSVLHLSISLAGPEMHFSSKTRRQYKLLQQNSVLCDILHKRVLRQWNWVPHPWKSPRPWMSPGQPAYGKELEPDDF